MQHPIPDAGRRQILAAWAATPLLTLAACGAAPRSPSAGTGGQGFTAWSEAFASDWVRASAEFATFTQYFQATDPALQAALERELTPATAERRQARREQARAGLARLQHFEAGALAPDERVGAAVMRWSLGRVLASEPFEDHGFAFNQMQGAQVRLVSFLAETHPLRTEADVDAYLSRLAQVPARMDEQLERARAAAARGLLPPRFIAERSREQMRAFLQPAPADNEFVQALQRRSARIAGLSPERRQQALQRATTLVAEGVRPAWQRALAWLEALLPRTTADAGLWRLPGGDEAYAQALAGATTTAMTADEIHATGLREVARIEAQMDAVLRGIGRSQGTVQQRMDALRAELQPPAEPDPRPALLERYAAHVRDAERRAQALFPLQPAAPVEVRRVPALTERTASAFYTTPAPDGSRPGVFWVPMPGPAFDMPKMRSLAVHEAVPGHHFQLALQQEQRDLPRWRQRRVFGGGSAHSEGWALYAERLAIDEGWYEGDPHSLLGALDAQLFRARRLVVDTGMHAKRWTREQAIAYGIGAQEVERYVANPGQACAYMVGMLRILAVREEARRLRGDAFSLPQFHAVVLRAGSVPLDVLGEVVRGWATA